MINIKNCEVKVRGSSRDTIVEILCGVLSIKECILMNDEKEIAEIFDEELQKITNCKSLNDLAKYEEEE